MDRSKQLAYCKVCSHSKMDFKQGMICGLTNAKAEFESTCAEFDKSKEKEEEQFNRKMAAAGSYSEGDSSDYEKNLKKGYTLLSMGALVGVVLYFALGIVIAGLITGTTIAIGVGMIMKGNEQKKLLEARERELALARGKEKLAEKNN